MWVSYTGIVVNKPMLPAEPKESVSIVFLLTVAGESWKHTHLIARYVHLDCKMYLSLLMNVFVQITECVCIFFVSAKCICQTCNMYFCDRPMMNEDDE